MVKKFLKIAGVKTEAEFYDKYPTEAAFFKAHPEAKDMKKYRQGGQQKKLKQLTDFQGDVDGILPKFQNAPFAIPGMAETNALLWGTNPNPMGAPVVGGVNPMGVINPGAQEAVRLKDLPGTPVRQVPLQTGKNFPFGQLAGAAGNIASGITKLKEQKQALKRAKQTKAVSDVSLEGVRSRPKTPIKQDYVRPEDVVIQPEQLFPTYGVGTNVLTAQDGLILNQIGGNPTEIQNMYNPGDLYSDLGYEPLDESNRVKQYMYGGVQKANFGDIIGKFDKQGGFSTAENIMNTIPGTQSGGGDLGAGIGQAVGTLIPIPGVGKALGLVGRGIGSLLDRSAAKTREFNRQTQGNLNQMMLMEGAGVIHSNNSAFMEDGGYLSHSWQPQVIATFGEHKLSDLLRPDPMMNTLRTGGNITQNYVDPEEEMITSMAMGGDLKTHWGGYAETISRNPYMAGTGEATMLRGNSHDESDGYGNTGVGMSFGGNLVEAERGEPVIQMAEGGDITNPDNTSAVVAGNLLISKEAAELAGNKKFAGMKYKNAVKDIIYNDKKLSKKMDKTMDQLDSIKTTTPFDMLKLNSLMAMGIGINNRFKQNKQTMEDLMTYQQAVNDTKEELDQYFGKPVNADALALGKVKFEKGKVTDNAKRGTVIEKAQSGDRLPALKKDDYDYLSKLYKEAESQGKGDKVLEFQQEFHRLAPEYAKKVIGREPITQYGKKKGLTTKDLESNEDAIFGKRTKQYMSALENASKFKMKVTAPIAEQYPTVDTTTTPYPVTPLKGFGIADVINQALPFIRPSDQEVFDLSQIQPELYALGTNQLEPVYAQKYTPQLRTPYDISLQDQLNEVTAQSRSAERMAMGDPSALANIAAQASRAKSQILGEQFRQNQAMREGVYSSNIAALNQAQLQNLGIMDTQAQRQAMAKSRTKETNLAALSSISDKVAKQRLENRTLGVMENLYNYRFTPSGRAINMNPLAQFDVTFGGSGTGATTGGLSEYEKAKAITDAYEKKQKKSAETARNGNIVKAIKGL